MPRLAGSASPARARARRPRPAPGRAEAPAPSGTRSARNPAPRRRSPPGRPRYRSRCPPAAARRRAWCATSASSRMGLSAPVEVSECTTVIGVVALPPERRLDPVREVHLAPAAPRAASASQPVGQGDLEEALAERAVHQRQDPSAAAVADRRLHQARGRGGGDVDRPVGAEDPLRPGIIWAMSCSIDLPRWPIMGRVWAARISGSTSVGPGRKKRPKAGALVAVAGDITADSGRRKLRRVEYKRPALAWSRSPGRNRGAEQSGKARRSPRRRVARRPPGQSRR